jgi:valine--pyruvate aminotransferase
MLDKPPWRRQESPCNTMNDTAPCSVFGERLGGRSAILDLMDDLAPALARGGAICMLGGGNPARIPAVTRVWRARMQALLADAGRFARLLAHYDTPQGNPDFLDAMASFLRTRYGWPVTERNIIVTNGSQQASFMLLNLFGGRAKSGRRRRILLPLMPEYVGYADQGVESGMFRAQRPLIGRQADGFFKYQLDLDALRVGADIGAICVSRPTNPTGNVLTDAEIAFLRERAQARGIPLIIDSAYGAPFPHILYRPCTPVWGPDIILTCSLSKLGLPGTRTGIVIAAEATIRALTAMNAVLNLASNNLGQALVAPLIRSGELEQLARTRICPFYAHRQRRALRALRTAFADGPPVAVHAPEGAFFLWLWFTDLPVATRVLYERLKARGVLVLPGEYFFFGLAADWPHARQCLRVSYALDPAAFARGIGIIAEEARLLAAPPARQRRGKPASR